MHGRYVSLAVMVAIISLQALPSFGAAGGIPQESKISIMADRLEFDHQAERIRGEGKIQVDFADLSFTCGEIDFSIPSRILWARKGVQLFPGRGWQLESDSLRLDVTSNLFRVQNSRILVEPSYYFTAETIEQVSPREIIATHAVYTACDPNDPVWKISFSRGEVDIGRSAMLRNITFRIKDTPVFYFPYFWFPINQEKAPGFLIPDFGRSSELGSFVQNYFYLPLCDWTDLGFPIDYFEKRGVGAGLEYRYCLTRSDFGRLRAYGIYDRQKGQRRAEATLQVQQRVASHTRAVAEVNALSDDDYYRDFRQEIGQRYNQSLESRAFAETSTDPWQVEVSADQATYLYEGPNIYYRRMPQVSFSTKLRSYAHFPLFMQWESSWADLEISDSQSKSLMKTQRVDLSPKIFTPIQRRLYTLTPWLGCRKTLYFQTDRQKEARNIFGGGLSLTGPRFCRSFPGRLDHTLYPQLDLVYETLDWDRSQQTGADRETVVFGLDQLDRLGENRQLSLSLINWVWEKEPTAEEKKEKGEPANRSSSSRQGQPWLSLILRQKYGFRKSCSAKDQQIWISQGRIDRSEGVEAGFKDFELEASSYPFPPDRSGGMMSHFDLTYNYDVEAGQNRLLDLRWSFGSLQDFFDLGWRYSQLEKIGDGGRIIQDQSISLLQANVQSALPLWVLPPSRWVGKVSISYDLESGSVVENQYSLICRGSCWSARLTHIQRFDGQRWNFTIGLESLGELGF